MAKQAKKIQYEDYQKLIAGVAWQWAKEANWDFQELMSEGNLMFMEIQKNFDSNKSCFSTYLTMRLNFHFDGLTRENWWREKKEVSDKIVSSDPPPDRVAAFREMLGHLSRDARLAAECALETPKELIWMLAGRDKSRITINRYSLQKYFIQKKGWSASRCWRAFSKVKLALNTL